MLPWPSRVLVTNPDRQLPCHFSKTVLRIPSTLPKATDNSDMYSRAFPIGNALFLIAGGMMSLFRLPRGKLPLPLLAVPAGKDRRVECPCQTFDGFIGVRGSVCALKTQAAIKRQGFPQSGDLAVLCYMLAESGSCPRLHNATLTGRTYTPSAV